MNENGEKETKERRRTKDKVSLWTTKTAVEDKKRSADKKATGGWRHRRRKRGRKGEGV